MASPSAPTRRSATRRNSAPRSATQARTPTATATDTDVESYQLTLYGDHLFGNAMYAKGLLAFGWHQNDIARHDVGGIPGNTATGAYDASAFNLRADSATPMPAVAI